MKQIPRAFNILLLSLTMLASALGAAESEPEAAKENKEPPIYFQIDPNILTFYQNSGRKFGYVVVQVQVVVRGQDNADLLELHMPLMQDALIDFFNRQDKATIQDLKQRESLRQQAKQVVSQVIQQEVGSDIVDNLLFTQYIFQ